MPLSVVFSAKSQSDLDSIEEYLAERFYPANAARFVDRLVELCNSLGSAPGLGRKQGHLGPGIRSIAFQGKVAIYFRASPDEIVILGIFYRGRRPTLKL